VGEALWTLCECECGEYDKREKWACEDCFPKKGREEGRRDLRWILEKKSKTVIGSLVRVGGHEKQVNVWDSSVLRQQHATSWANFEKSIFLDWKPIE
jgi:hypothetical protein